MPSWLNGEWVEAPRLDSSDRGFTLGDGLFETIRLAEGRPRHLPRHLARLVEGSRVLDLPLPAAIFALEAVIVDLARRNDQTDGVVRLTLSRGPAPRGLLPPAEPRPTLLLTLAPPPPPPGPARLVIATVTRRNEFSPLARLKTLNYLDNLLARQEAARRGADDALLLNGQGRAADTTIATLFVRLGGRVLTPPVSEGALPGVARALALEAGLAEEQSLTVADLAQAEAIVLANSLGARPVIALNDRPVFPCDALTCALVTILRDGAG